MTKKMKTIAIILSAIFSIGSTFALARLLKKDDEPKTEQSAPSSAEIDFEYFEDASNYKLLKIHEARTVNYSQGGFYVRCYGQGTLKLQGESTGQTGTDGETLYKEIIFCAAHDDVYENQITDGSYITRYEFTSEQYYNRVNVYGERPAYNGTDEAEDKTETEGVTLYYSEYTDYYIPKLDEKVFKDTSGNTYSLATLLGAGIRPVHAIDAYILWPKG